MLILYNEIFDRENIYNLIHIYIRFITLCTITVLVVTITLLTVCLFVSLYFIKFEESSSSLPRLFEEIRDSRLVNNII